MSDLDRGGRGIMPGMQVLTSDGEVLGTVDEAKSDGFMLRRMGSPDADREPIPEMWVHRIDDQVHLNRTGAEAVSGWKSLKFKTTSGDRPAVPEDAREERSGGGTNWIIWLLLAAVALVAVLILSNLF